MNEYTKVKKQTNKFSKAYPILFLTDKDKKANIWQASITACHLGHLVEVKSMRTSGVQDLCILNARAMSVLTELPHRGKSRAWVIMTGSQNI